MMCKNILIKNSILLVGILMISCGRSSVSDYMILDEIKYVTVFPHNFSLDEVVDVELDVELDIIGVNSFRIYDSLLILSTSDRDGLWSFVSLPDYTFLGKFLTIGQGPFEFSQSISVEHGDLKLFNDNNELFAAIYNFHNGNLYMMNVDKSIADNKLNICTFNDSLPRTLFNFAMLDSSTFLCREINFNRTQQNRYVLSNGTTINLTHLDKLNLSSVRQNENFNILATDIKHNSENNLIIEMPIYLNYLNLYSLDGSFGQTICIGNNLDNISKIMYKKEGDRIYTFSNLRLFSKYWGVLHINEDWNTFETERKRLPDILLFDWNGDPLAKIKLSRFATSFDIDFVNGFLYTLDTPTDRFFKYNIRDILEKL